MTARSANASPSGIKRMAISAAHIHCAREQVHDDVAAAEYGDSQAHIEQCLFQGESPGALASGVAGLASN